MNREEAIAELKKYHRQDRTVPEEIKMGIEALEKLDKVEKIINSDIGDKYAYDEILKILEGE